MKKILFYLIVSLSVLCSSCSEDDYADKDIRAEETENVTPSTRNEYITVSATKMSNTEVTISVSGNFQGIYTLQITGPGGYYYANSLSARVYNFRPPSYGTYIIRVSSEYASNSTIYNHDPTGSTNPLPPGLVECSHNRIHDLKNTNFGTANHELICRKDNNKLELRMWMTAEGRYYIGIEEVTMPHDFRIKYSNSYSGTLFSRTSSSSFTSVQLNIPNFSSWDNLVNSGTKYYVVRVQEPQYDVGGSHIPHLKKCTCLFESSPIAVRWSDFRYGRTELMQSFRMTYYETNDYRRPS